MYTDEEVGLLLMFKGLHKYLRNVLVSEKSAMFLHYLQCLCSKYEARNLFPSSETLTQNSSMTLVKLATKILKAHDH